MGGEAGASRAPSITPMSETERGREGGREDWGVTKREKKRETGTEE